MESSSSLIGKYIGKYKVESLLGRGGMAEVYKAYQETLDRHVAIKLMHPFLASDQNFMSRFRREARTMAAIDHPNIIDVFDFDTAGDRSYIVMQYLPGGALKDRQEDLAAEGLMMPLSESVRILLEVADALAYAHSNGLIHRDIKPANIMFSESGRSILTDFGIAKMMSGQTLTATGAMVGTPAYMSPEQGMGQPGDERSDIYALGVLFYQMTTGQLPHDADAPLAVLLKHINEIPVDPSVINPNISPALETVILTAMAKKPEDRYQTPHEMARDLRQALTSTGNTDLRRSLPSTLVQDRPTPLPGKTFRSSDSGQIYADGGDATMLGPDRSDATAVTPPPGQLAKQEPAAATAIASPG